MILRNFSLNLCLIADDRTYRFGTGLKDELGYDLKYAFLAVS